MKFIFKSLIPLCLLYMQFIGCLNPSHKIESNNLKKSPQTYHEIEKVDYRIRIDSLLSSNKGNKSVITRMADVYNLDILNGFRGLNLNMPFESINFLNAKIDTNEFDNSIISVDFSADINIIGKDNYDQIKLVFYNEKLISITISQHFTSMLSNLSYVPDIIINDQIDRHNSITDPSNNSWTFPINETYNTLVALYGMPNIEYDGLLNIYINKTGSGGLIDHYDSKYTISENKSWKSTNLILTYSGSYSFNTDKSVPVKYFNLVNVSLEYSSIKYKALINNKIRSINDSLKKAWENQKKLDLLKKF